MMKDCRKGKIDRIYTKSISRFARNTRDCLKNVRELKELGITILFEKENIDTAKITDEMMITIMGGLAQEESTSISNNIRWSIRQRMKSGTMKMCTSVFGYDLSEGKLILNENEAVIVRTMFDWYLSGYGLTTIANSLNRMMILKQGKICQWTAVSVGLILRNEKYVGDQIFQKKYTTDTLLFIQKMNKGERNKYYYPSTHESIISKEVFEEAQKLLEIHKQSDKGIRYRHIFAKKIYCSECNATFKRKLKNNKFYWICRTHDTESGKCKSKPIAEYRIYFAFIRLCNKLLHNYKQILVPTYTELQDMKTKSFDGQAQVIDIRKEIADLKEQSHVLARLRTKGYIDEPKYLEQTTELTAKINKLQKELKKLTQSDDEDEAIEQLEMLIDFFEKRDIPFTKFEESAFESIVEKIVVENYELHFHVLGRLVFKEII